MASHLSWAQYNNYQTIELNFEDSLKASKIPELILPESYKHGKKSVLPYKLNNAELPFFRPIFAQDGASCGQAASVGYDFTY